VASAAIEVSDLWTGSYHERASLAELDADENCHIHGRFRIVINGRELPRLGFFGPDDVCLNEWTEQLLRIRGQLGATAGRYVFDEGEQGQPAFAFERSGGDLFVSVLRSEIGDANGDESWSRVVCSAGDFLAAVDEVLDVIHREVSAIGAQGERWWNEIAAAAATDV
jgi:hypothetical protein